MANLKKDLMVPRQQTIDIATKTS